MTEPAARGPYAKGVRRRREILERALDVFAERGSSGTSLRAIAGELEIGHATIGHYFASLEALKLAVVAGSEERTADRLAETDERPPTLRGRLRRSAEINTGIPGLIALYTSMLATAVEPNDVLSREHFTRRFAVLRAEVATSIEAGRAAGVTPPGADATALAALVIAAFDGLQVQWLLDPAAIDLPGVLALLEPLIGDAPAVPPDDRGEAADRPPPTSS